MSESENHVCDTCGREFDSKTGLSIHETNGHSKPWHDPDRLRELYHEQNLTTYEVADRLGCTQTQIRISMDNFGMKRRSASEALSGKRQKKAQYKHPCWGHERYPCWSASNGGDTSPEKFYVHRLLAIAEYGTEAVVEKDVHHKNGVPWDNRPENIELIDPSAHGVLHHIDRSIDRKEISRLYHETELSNRKIARKMGVAHETVRRIGERLTSADDN